MSQTNNKTHKLYKLIVWQRYAAVYVRYFASESEARKHVKSEHSKELPENQWPGDGVSHTEITEFIFVGPKPKTESEMEAAWASDDSKFTRSIYFVKP